MDEAERRDQVSKLFADLTATFEDAATIAADGQGPSLSPERLASLAAAIGNHLAHAHSLREQVAKLISEL
jgi:hypothetical protein